MPHQVVPPSAPFNARIDPYQAGRAVGAWLVANDRLRGSDFDRVRRLSETSDETFVALLSRLGVASERDIALAWSATLHLPLIEAEALSSLPVPDWANETGDLSAAIEEVAHATHHSHTPHTAHSSHTAHVTHGETPLDAGTSMVVPAVELKAPSALTLSQRFLRYHALVPLATDEHTVTLLVADPTDYYAAEACGFALERDIRMSIGIRSQISETIERFYGQGRSAMSAIVEALDDADGVAEDVEYLRDLASEAPVIRLVNLIIQRAVEERASDIHIEPFEQRLKVRYRVDGVLRAAEAPPSSSTAAVISRVKIMAKLDIAERRLPQDGRIMLRLQGRELDLRVSTLPTSFGESVVMRILDRESVVFDLPSLGFDAQASAQLLRAIERPHGILLVTGPTGSGKTTTLYTALSHLNTPDRKIITVEDPVEYQLDGINQIQVKSSIGLHFAAALRSIVRQDPDVVMIGEMRDLETCRIAIQSALTGHLVLSTLHTNSAAATIARLLDMGADDYLVASTVHGIVAQRLVRRLDPALCEAYEASAATIAHYGLEAYTDERPIRLYRPKPGVAEADAYHGRCVLSEFLSLDDDLRQMVIQRCDAQQIEQAAKQKGMTTMFEDGLRKALTGMTTIEEVVRSISET